MQGQDAPYSVEVRWSPAHEMLMSLSTYVNYPELKLLDLGAGWRREVRRHLPPSLSTRLDDLQPVAAPYKKAKADEQVTTHSRALRALLFLLAWASPAGLSAGELPTWARSVPVAELLEIISAAFGPAAEVPANLADLRDQAADLLAGWYDGYFASIDPAIIAGLRADAQAKSAMARQMPAQELVEAASSGVVLESVQDFETIVLIPQYHSRPWNVFSEIGGKLLLYYPAEAWSAPPGEPSTRLIRLTRALSDESRLRILAFIAGGTRTFGAIADHLGLAKSTIHHHMVVLRAAGLVRVYSKYSQYLGDRYALRREALAELGTELEHFLNPEGSP